MNILDSSGAEEDRIVPPEVARDGGAATILIHTANRPDQLFRLLRYHSETPSPVPLRLLVADGSDAERATMFDALIAGADLQLAFDLQRFPPDLPFQKRISQALAQVTSRFVLLAADDDFYFPDWLEGALAKFDEDPSTISVVGNSFGFTLKGFGAFSSDISFADSAPERFGLPWLGDDSAEARVAELSKNTAGIQTEAWYAVHRTAPLQSIFAHGSAYELPTLLFERFYSVAQAATGKTWCSPEIFLARQKDADPDQLWWRGEPMSFTEQRGALQVLADCTRSYLTSVLGMTHAEAAEIAEKAFAYEIAMMRQADRRRIARRLINSSGLRRLLNRYREATPPPARDPRLPPCCDPDEMMLRAQQVRHACRPVQNAS